MKYFTEASERNENGNPYAKIIVEALRPVAEIINIVPRRNLSLYINNVQYCYLLLNGNFGIYRKNDNRMVAVVYCPNIFGVAGMVAGQSGIYIKALTSATVGKISLNVVEHTIEALELWKPLSLYMMSLSSKLYIYGEKLSATTAYEIICLQLNELMNEKKFFREGITAERYIRDKTNLSRSRIMKILSGLRQGGFIEIHRGVLVNISALPSKIKN
ncbi:helix-turn-helix domain-containing protein [Salmonella enterica]|nr:Crp/Fnr family transcriptional regulator [Salmonella enterica]EGS4024462.1 Crp/Fnr family transcriptional regulator [Salmonella enterica]EHT4473673.1 helix-turn-helix domain-containing protein [Salmonella enterica]EKM9605738.1 helix-turn-helix domain-containing protein [Salmonella enterica]EKQ1382520.1 helix-turn-helix domain-containing protein [Salmonella enterica]